MNTKREPVVNCSDGCDTKCHPGNYLNDTLLSIWWNNFKLKINIYGRSYLFIGQSKIQIMKKSKKISENIYDTYQTFSKPRNYAWWIVLILGASVSVKPVCLNHVAMGISVSSTNHYFATLTISDNFK